MDSKELREKIINNLLVTNRPGIKELVTWLELSDFFTAPCSTQYHLAQPGGLAEHSWNVYHLLFNKVQQFKLDIPKESIAICGLLHDICKTFYYGRAKKNVKENGVWMEKEIYVVKDKLPLGHGEKSISIIQDFIKLTDDEKLAIRWHMLAFDAGIHFFYPSGAAFREASKRPLVTLLFTADYEASQIIEGGEDVA